MTADSTVVRVNRPNNSSREENRGIATTTRHFQGIVSVRSRALSDD
jgi:hypothetical protein